MVNILPESPSFGTQLARGLGTGLSAGVSQGSEMATKLGLEKYKSKQRLENLKKYREMSSGGATAIDPEQKRKAFLELVPKAEQMAGRELSSEDLDGIWKNMDKFMQPAQQARQPHDYFKEAEDLDILGEKGQSKIALERGKQDRKDAIAREKSIDRSYDFHKDFISDTTSAYKAFETDTKPKLLQMQKLNDEELIGPGSAKFLDLFGIPLGVLENPSNELYDKVSQDLLKGLPESYGSRILQVEVQNFLKTIPRLINSPDGRRMIASNALKLGEMKEAFYKEMRRQQETYGEKDEKLPKDFQQKVFDNVKPQLDRINNEFMKIAEIKSVPPGTVPYFNPQGEISFVPKDKTSWAEQNGGKRIW